LSFSDAIDAVEQRPLELAIVDEAGRWYLLRRRPFWPEARGRADECAETAEVIASSDVYVGTWLSGSHGADSLPEDAVLRSSYANESESWETVVTAVGR
jgi:hypothetical protein